MATIRLQQVSKQFHQPSPLTGRNPDRTNQPVTALDQVNLTIPNGQTVAIVGPSGSGKSTLLRVVAGLENDYSGQVFFDDQLMANIAPKERQIGMVFQNYALYPHFAGEGNLSFFFRLRKAPSQEIEERIRITSDLMGIGFDQLLERKPGTLSGGQQQRLAIARAIVRNPRLFLLDEPLSNLDAKLRTQTRVEIKRLLQRFQITGIYVTHDQTEAIALGDQIAVMRQGRVEQVAPFQELMAQPINLFVAGFLGTPPMNLLPSGEVVDGVVHVGALSWPLPSELRNHVHSGQQITLGIRPEAAQIIPSEQGGLDGVSVKGIAEVVEADFGRRMQLVYVRSGDVTYTATAPLVPPLSSGQPVVVHFPSDQLYCFDSTSGMRLG